MRCALFGPIPGSLPSSSIRSWTGPSNMAVGSSEPWYLSGWGRRATQAGGQRPQPLLRHCGDLLGGVDHGAHDQVLQGLDVRGVYDLWIDLHRDHLAAALNDDLDQASTGLTTHLGVRELMLSFHQLFLPLCRLGEQRRHIASGLHDNPLASWSRVGFACGCRAIRNTQRRPRGATFAPWIYE